MHLVATCVSAARDFRAVRFGGSSVRLGYDRKTVSAEIGQPGLRHFMAEPGVGRRDIIDLARTFIVLSYRGRPCLEKAAKSRSLPPDKPSPLSCNGNRGHLATPNSFGFSEVARGAKHV